MAWQTFRQVIRYQIAWILPALALCVASQGHSSDSGISELCFSASVVTATQTNTITVFITSTPPD